MSKLAKIQNGVVKNIIVASISEALPQDAEWVDVSNVPCNIGWLYADGIFTDPTPPPEQQPSKSAFETLLDVMVEQEILSEEQKQLIINAGQE